VLPGSWHIADSCILIPECSWPIPDSRFLIPDSSILRRPRQLRAPPASRGR
jgi:hypothetical protein